MKTKTCRILLAGALLAAIGGWPAWGYVLINPVTVWQPGTIPMQIKLGSSSTLSDGTNHSTSVQAAMQTWNGLLGTVQFDPQIVATGGSNSSNDINEIVFSSTVEGQAFGTGVLAVTLTSYSPSVHETAESDIIFNSAVTWDSYRGTLRTSEDIRRVALHELGHVLGLDHPDVYGQGVTALMNSQVSDLDSLATDDITGAQSLYRAPGDTAVPANDNFASATAITLIADYAQLTGSSIYATKETGEPNHAGEAGGHSVWWKWTAPRDGGITADTNGSYFDTVIGVYTGTAVSSLTLITSNDDVDPGEIRYSSVKFNVTAGTTYYIAVDGWEAHSGRITMNLKFDYPPTITAQPINIAVNTGDTATFTVVATGLSTLTYQWRRNGSNLGDGGNVLGATNATLTVSPAEMGDAGNYDVVVSSGAASITSKVAALTVTPAPTITSLSPARNVIQSGQNFNLSVTATGTGSLSYQWVHNGRTIDGATSSNFSLSSATYQDGGWYLVLITDSNGTRRSVPIFVLIAPAQTEVVAWGDTSYGTAVPTGLTNVITVSCADEYAVGINADGTLVAWGYHSSAYLPLPSPSTGFVAVAAGAFHVLGLKPDGTVVAWGGGNYVPAGLNNVVAVAAGYYDSYALRSDGTVVAWYVHTGTSIPLPAGLTNVVGITTKYALKSDGTVIPLNSYTPTAPEGTSGVTSISTGPGPTNRYHTLTLQENGTIREWSSSGLGDIPSGLNGVRNIAAGAYHSLALKNDGTVVAWGPDSYAKLIAIPEGTNSVFAVSGGTRFSVALRDATHDTVPVIITQPASQTVVELGTATLSVAATSTGPVTYQWRKNGTNINGAIASTLAFNSIALSDASTYDVVITNHVGSVISSGAILTVNPLPVITNLSTPRNVVRPGQSLTFTVAATGTGLLNYQWVHNGQAVSGATSNSYPISSASYQDSGWYVVLITDNYGTRRSPPIFVTVAPAQTRVVVWGDNGSGQSNAPAGLADAVGIAAGPAYTLAVKADGTLAAWGDIKSFSPLSSSPSGFVAVASCAYFPIGLQADGTVVALGSANAVPANLTNVVAIAAGAYDFYALNRLLKKSSFGIRDRPRKKMTLRNRPRIKDLHRVEAQASPDFGRFFRHVDFFSSLLSLTGLWWLGRRLLVI